MDLGTALTQLIVGRPAIALTVLIAVDLALGVIEAKKAKEPLTLRRLGTILQKVLPYFGGYLVLGTMGNELQSWWGDTLRWAATVLAGSPFFQSGADNVAKLLSLQLPPVVQRFVLGRTAGKAGPTAGAPST